MLTYNDDEIKAIRDCLKVLQNRKRTAESHNDILVLCVIDFLEEIISKHK